MPPAFTTTSARDLRALAAVLDGHAASTRPPLDADPTSPACAAGSTRRAPRAPAASACARPDGSSQPSVGSHTAPRTPSVDISGKRSRASVGRDELERQAERLRPAGLARAAPRSARASTPAGASRPRARTGSTPGLGGQPAVQVGAVHHHPGQRDASCGAGRRGRRSGTSSPRSARPARRARRRSSRAASGGRRCEVPPTPPPMITARACSTIALASPPPTPCRRTA